MPAGVYRNASLDTILACNLTALCCNQADASSGVSLSLFWSASVEESSLLPP